ncbi:colicin E3/pyocin S6 family cytotoxin [Pseudomonas gingeri]|uniref:S-type pyocin domain-containing protein n=1 Tax=Pseudomonas gingeri TaxID=117681 RepID=A0A7Y7W9K1_9PSED|nr:colicin E3/pyocin S6 family cytotoxin [Pseudomonas gingeri]NWB45333.1 S-type pyocin domain-containing protein [Pseudomonas gingeri]
MGLKWGNDFFEKHDKKGCLFCRPGQPCSWCNEPGWRAESWGCFGGVEQNDPAQAPPQIPLQKESWLLPKPSQGAIFAKSCEPANWCCTEAGTVTEPASHFGKVMVSKTKAIPPGAAALGVTLEADAALGRIAGGGIVQEGFRWMLRSAMVAGGGATVFIAGMLPARLGDGTLYSDDELRQMAAAASRVRFQFRHDAEGVLQLYGIHTAASGDDSVRIVKAQWRADGRTLEAHLGDGITLLWTPNGGPLLTPELTFPEHTDAPMGSILVHPIEEGVDSQIDGYPVADDVTLGDRIITFPINSGLKSIYVVFSKPFWRGHSYHPAPKGLTAFPDAKVVPRKTPVQGDGHLRKRWKTRDGTIFEWDSQHGAVEKYNRRGKHLGEFNSETGEQTKPADKTREVEP